MVDLADGASLDIVMPGNVASIEDMTGQPGPEGPPGPAGTGNVDTVNGDGGPDVLLTQDDIPDGTTAKQFTATEKTKLAGVADGATAYTNADADARVAAAVGVSVQAFDADLSAIAALSPSNDDVIQRKAGSWVARTMAQLKVDLAVVVADISDFAASVASAITAERTAVATYTNKDLTAGTNTFPTFNQNTTGSAAKWTTARTIAITGDLAYSQSVDGSANVTGAGTLATVNSNVGSFGSASSVATFTVDGKGRITAAGSTSIAIPASAIASGTIDTARLGSGTADNTRWLRGDSTWGDIEPVITTSIGAVFDTATTTGITVLWENPDLTLTVTKSGIGLGNVPNVDTTTGGGREASAALSATTGTCTGDLSAASVFTISPTGNFTLAFSNVPATGTACTTTLIITQGGTPRTLTMPAGNVWMQAAPTQVANKVCIVTTMTVDGGTTWYSTAVVQP